MPRISWSTVPSCRRQFSQKTGGGTVPNRTATSHEAAGGRLRSRYDALDRIPRLDGGAVSRAFVLLLAHPDDETFFAGGTIAQCVTQGVRVGLLCATRGERGATG